MSGKRLSREAIAHIEIGATAISRPMSWLLSCFFLLAVFLVPIAQYQIDGKPSENSFNFWGTFQDTSEKLSFFSNIKRKNTLFLENLDELETSLEEESFLRSLFLPPLQSFFLNLLKQGNEKAVVGEGGWLFYRPGVDSLSGPPFLDKKQLQLRVEARELWEEPVQPDPVQAIVDFHRQLNKRGITLVLLPVPVKASIHPEKISRDIFTTPPANHDWTQFLQRLEEAGVTVFDSRSLLYDYAQKHGSAFLTTDTHWLPGAMDLVAKKIAGQILSDFPDLGSITNLVLQEQKIEAEGDVAKMLTLPESSEPFLQSVTIEQVVNSDNELWQPETDSEILLLGDSFTNIYSTIGLGWGRSSGFAEHLSYHLQQPLDLLSRNDSGAFVTREMLGLELARGRDRLAGKKIVIWEFAERELTHGDWKLIDLSLGAPMESGFFVAESGQEFEVQAVAAAVSKSARPGSVPYRDNILTLHLVDIKGENGGLAGEQALVYGFGMQDNVLTDLANVRPGDQIAITLSAWEDVEGDYGSYRRSPLDDEMMELELPNWGILNHDEKN
jgi:hypothetical protein